MASKTVVTLIDDIDGSEAKESLTFTYNGVTYEIDLSERNAAQLDQALAPYVDVARKVGGTRTRTASTPARNGGRTRTDSAQLKAIRAWARDKGMEVSDRGRISGLIQEAYQREHRQSA